MVVFFLQHCPSFIHISCNNNHLHIVLRCRHKVAQPLLLAVINAIRDFASKIVEMFNYLEKEKQTMAMNDISLTPGMRSNLVQLQATVALLDRTQERLASGKKVNSPLDNPINFFAAQGHMTRASDIAQYKDGMAEGIQTIQSANAGIKGITALIESAKALAQSALVSDPNQLSFAVTTAFAVGDVITIGGTAYTAVQSATGATGDYFIIGESGEATAKLSIDEMVANLAAKINSTVDPGAFGEGDLKATNVGSRITLQSKSLSQAITTVDVVEVTTAANFDIDEDVTSDRGVLATQYMTLLGQIDTLAGAAGYKGNNLLTKDTLSVTFEGGSIAVKGFNAYASDLGVNITGFAKATLEPTEGPNTFWALISDINFDIANMDKGITSLKQEASSLSSALTVITIQQDFSTAKINLLNKGADTLTAADTNEEGANMLMLQTRQALSTTALSLSAQAAQSVLRLFA
jgi:flagellin